MVNERIEALERKVRLCDLAIVIALLGALALACCYIIKLKVDHENAMNRMASVARFWHTEAELNWTAYMRCQEEK
jgi:hypothetical protein